MMKTFTKRLLILLSTSWLVACGGGSVVPDADNDQVITLGDSIFALSNDLQTNLESYAGETFRKYTRSGAELEGGIGVPSVVEQYAEARQDNANIDVVVMNGGGNDILIPVITLLDPYNCKTQWYQYGRLSGRCKNFIDDLYVDGVNLLNEMAGDDVQHAVYLGYYDTKHGVLRLDSLEEAVDYGNATLARVCSNSVLDCQFVDPRASIDDRDIIFDGIHPAASGSKKLADLVWPVLQPLL
jgi:lysophospholipase L1-like esterase